MLYIQIDFWRENENATFELRFARVKTKLEQLPCEHFSQMRAFLCAKQVEE